MRIFILPIILSLNILTHQPKDFKSNLQKPQLNSDSKSVQKAVVNNLIKNNLTKDKVIKDTGDSFDWNNIISAIVGGLIGLSPSIIALFKPIKIQGRILSQYANLISLSGKPQMVFFQKLSIFTSNKNLNLKDINIFIKFPNSSELKTINWVWRNLSFTLPVNQINVNKSLNVNQKDYLLHLITLPKDTPVVGYISFSCDYLKDENYEFIKYEFIDFKGKAKLLTIHQSEISDSTQMYDDSIWV